MKTIAAILLCVSMASAQYHVTTTGGGAESDGSISQPWRLTYALDSAAVAGGDTVNIHSGDYIRNTYSLVNSFYGAFSCRKSGSAGNPLVYRNYNNERVRIIGGPSSTDINYYVLIVESEQSYVWFWGLEFTSTGTDRLSDSAKGHYPYDVNFPGGATTGAYGTNNQTDVRFINCQFYELSEGIDAWVRDLSTVMYGNLVYNIGQWHLSGTVRENGYGSYMQHDTSTNLVVNNVYSNIISGYGNHAYGSSGPIKNINQDSNFCYRGSFLAGGSSGSENVQTRNNVMFSSTVSHGYNDSARYSTIKDNLVIQPTAYYQMIRIREPYNVGVTGNIVTDAINYVTQDDADHSPSYADSNTSWAALPVVGDTSFVYPNAYESGRAHIAVMNWDSGATVSVSVSGVYGDGDILKLVNAMNPWGDSAHTAVVSGGNITIPMDTSRWHVLPYQATDSIPTQSFPVVGYFVATLTGQYSGSDVAPTVTSNPTGGTTRKGLTRTFTVEASGTTPTYQWQKNASNITGATSASYTTPAVTIADNGAQYRCIVSNAAGSDTSNAATLSVVLNKKAFRK